MQSSTVYKSFWISALLAVTVLFAQTLYAVHSPQTFYEHSHHSTHTHAFDEITDHFDSHDSMSHTHHTETSGQYYAVLAVLSDVLSVNLPHYNFSSIPFIYTPPKRPPKA